MLRCKCLFLYFSTKVPCDWFVSEFLIIHLAFIKAYENMLMLITVQIDNRQIKSSFWIGGTDFIVEGQWVWISTQKNLTYPDWAHDEPYGNISENCAQLGAHENLQWNIWCRLSPTVQLYLRNRVRIVYHSKLDDILLNL